MTIFLPSAANRLSNFVLRGHIRAVPGLAMLKEKRWLPRTHTACTMVSIVTCQPVIARGRLVAASSAAVSIQLEPNKQALAAG